MNNPRRKIFISYKREELQYVELLRDHLNPYIRNSYDIKDIPVFCDANLPPGERWRDAIRTAIGESVGAILMVSVQYLNSAQVAEECKQIFAAHDTGKLIVGWILVGDCGWEEIEEFRDRHTIYSTEKALMKLEQWERDEVLKKFCREFTKALSNFIHSDHPTPPNGNGSRPNAVKRNTSFSKLYLLCALIAAGAAAVGWTFLNHGRHMVESADKATFSITSPNPGKASIEEGIEASEKYVTVSGISPEIPADRVILLTVTPETAGIEKTELAQTHGEPLRPDRTGKWTGTVQVGSRVSPPVSGQKFLVRAYVIPASEYDTVKATGRVSPSLTPATSREFTMHIPPNDSARQGANP